jgi:hypothetical protein
MGNQTDYFNRIGYQSTYSIGDRVFGRFNNIPFVGTVGNDRVVSPVGPEITVHLDLPIRINGEVKNFIVVKHQDIKQTLKEIV